MYKNAHEVKKKIDFLRSRNQIFLDGETPGSSLKKNK